MPISSAGSLIGYRPLGARVEIATGAWTSARCKGRRRGSAKQKRRVRNYSVKR